ncbi:MAG: GPR endopeptidase [Clostridia bacterium]|nr:GPR endopeptidase [Clostridia bacterium]
MNGKREGKQGAGPAFRTDLACEAGRPCAVRRERCETVAGRPVTVTRSREADGGRYVTVSCGPLGEWEGDALTALAGLLAGEMTALSALMLGHPLTADTRVLVAGLGNAAITPDALGPGTVSRMTVTRHLRQTRRELYEALGCCELSALAPGVLGQTGIEAALLIRQAADTAGAELIVAVDALAARSVSRLAATIQLSDTGLSPGAGIGNRRMTLNADTAGRPVLSLGIPTVVDSGTLLYDALTRAGMDADSLPASVGQVLESGRTYIVTPRDCDAVNERSCMLLSRALDMAYGIERG